MSALPPFKFWATDMWLILTPGSSVPNAAPPGMYYTISRSADGKLLGLFYNGNFQVPGIHYMLYGRIIMLKFRTQIGDNLYAAYMATTYN